MVGSQRDIVFAGLFDPRRRTDPSTTRAQLTRALSSFGEPTTFGSGAVALAAVGFATAAPPTSDGSVFAVYDGYFTEPIVHRQSVESVLAERFAREGTDFVAGLRGAFSIICWDGRRERGVIARDHLGQRPMFFFERGGTLFFATEIKPLLDILPTRPAPSGEAIARFFAPTESIEPRLLYEGIQRLGHGELIDLSEGGWRIGPYWRPRFHGDAKLTSPEITAETRDRIAAAVGRHTGDATKFGIFLSGGLDSSAVAAFALERFRGSGKELRGYSALFPHVEPVDESEQIDAVATHLGLPMTRMSVYAGSSLAGLLETLDVWGYPELTANGFFMRPLSAEARDDGIEVVIGGEGGDEIFAAPELAVSDLIARGAALEANRLLARFPNIEYFPGWRTRLRLLRDFGILPVLPARVHTRFARRRDAQAFPDHLAKPWANHLARTADPRPWRHLDGPRWWRYRADGFVRKASFVGAAELILRSARLRRVLHRHPLLDLDLVEWMAHLPPSESFDAALTRPILRRAIKGMVPDAVRLRPQKATFDAVRGYSLQEDIDVVRRLVLAPDARTREYTRPHAVEGLLGQVPATWGELSTWSDSVWRLVTIESWLRLQDEPGFARELLESGELIGFYRTIQRS